MSSLEKHVFRLSWLTIIPHLLAMIVFVGFITLPIQLLRILTTKIEVNKDKIYGQVGILNRTTQDSPIEKIQSVRVDRSFIGRILGYGTITITTAGAGYEYKGMAHPEKIREVINGYM